METLTRSERRERRRAALRATRLTRERRAGARRVLVWGILILAVAGGVYGMSRLASRPSSSLPLQPIDHVTAEDWASGPSDARVTVIEYSDFQCPACSAYEPMVKRLREEFTTEMRFVYRHFPLPQHQNAEAAALAAEAAGKQGKFWEMHDKLFAEQSAWAEDSSAAAKFQDYAAALGLDQARFTADVASSQLRDRVEASASSGTRAGVDSTPTFFLNGQKLENPRTYDEFRDIINRALGQT